MGETCYYRLFAHRQKCHYNGRMALSADIMRVFILGDLIAMVLLAGFYLRRRTLSWPAFIAWGLLALFLPVMGPFLVISLHPGEQRV